MGYSWKIEQDGVDISDKIGRFDVVARQDQYCRELTLQIIDKDFFDAIDFTAMPDDPEIEVFTKTEETWISQGKFFIERPVFEVNIDQSIIRGLWGRSEIAKLGNPFAAVVTTVWNTDTTFFDICDELCTTVGLTWNSSYSDISNFTIYASTYNTERMYPIEIISQLAEFAGAYVTTDREGYVCIKQINYNPSSYILEITDDPIKDIIDSAERPEFGNRIKISASGTLGGYGVNLIVPQPCLPADGVSKAKVYCQVIDGDGSPVQDVIVSWTLDADYASLSYATTNTQEILIANEQQRSSNFYAINVDFEPSSVEGVWAYKDTAKVTNFIDSGYSISGNTITLSDKLDYCDQLLRITYKAQGLAINYVVAGSSSEDITLTAEISGQRDSEELYIDNPCQCPASLQLTASPSSIYLGEVSHILIYAEENGGPIITGRRVFISEGSVNSRGTLAWQAANLGIVNVSNEKTVAKNEITGTTQCDIDMFPKVGGTITVYQADDDDNPTGSDLYSSHVGKVIDLDSSVASGTTLLVTYMAQGAALNTFTGTVVGTALINGFLIANREQPVEDSVNIFINDPSSGLGDDTPSDWDSTDWSDGGSGGTGTGATGAADLDEFDPNRSDIWPDGGATRSCLPLLAENDPTTENLAGRFAFSQEQYDCTCEEICVEELEHYGTTQGYDDSSYRPINEIVIDDYGFADGTPEYYEKYEELEADATASCLAECNVGCENDLEWSDTNPETIAPSSSAAFSVSGNAPYTYSVVGTGFTLSESSNATGTNTLITDASACGSATIQITDNCGNTLTGYIRSTVGQWVLKSSTCALAGEATTDPTGADATDNRTLEKISGNKKQTQVVGAFCGVAGSFDESDCSYLCSTYPRDFWEPPPVYNPCLTPIGQSAYPYGGSFIECNCDNGFIDPPAYFCYRTTSTERYYEWEC